MPLPKKVRLENLYEKVFVNVFDIKTHEIVFTGGICDVATFLNVTESSVSSYLKTKSRFKNKYALRMAKDHSK